MESRICLIAEGVVRDAETNNVSVFNILERVTGAGFPLLLQKLTAFAFWEREAEEPSDWTGRIVLTLDDEELMTQPWEANFGENLNNRSIITIQGMVLPRPGLLTIRFQPEGAQEVAYSVRVRGPEPTIEVQENGS